MVTSTGLMRVGALLGLSAAVFGQVVDRRDVSQTCQSIAAAISSASNVYYPIDLQYTTDNYHWASSSTQSSTCSVEPGTAQDVGIILQIVGSTRTPFAVKGGGHASNPGFSSTPGVQISMSRFSEVTYDSGSQTAVVGSGLIWDEVYQALEPFNVNVVGGRVTGVGVAGFTLGGGYSWLSNQHGLTVDTVQAFELVKPDGTVTTVTADDEDLFWALKGGFNNFGIVTKFTLKTFPQGQVWGGLMTITAANVNQTAAAVTTFAATVTDPKAGIIPTFNFVLGQPGVSLLMFYDGPTPPAGIFDNFLAIPSFTKDVSTRSFISLVQAAPSNATAGTRGLFNSVGVLKYSKNVMDTIVSECITVGTQLSLSSTATFVSYDVEPFQPDILSHGPDSAYPATRSIAYLPTNLYFAYTSSLADQAIHDALVQSAATIKAAAIADGQNVQDSQIYGNYALYDQSLEGIYGDHVARLQQIKAAVDPGNVMGLAGGFKF